MGGENWQESESSYHPSCFSVCIILSVRELLWKYHQKEVPPSNSNWEVGFRGVRLISRPAHLAPLAGI